MRRLTKYPLLIALLAIVALGLGACGGDDDEPDATRQEQDVQKTGYEALTQAEPAKGMTYPVTRKTINAWVETWNVPGQLAFTYITNESGQKVGYYVFEGPPVTECAALTPPYRFEKHDVGDFNGDIQVPAPSLDGVFYSGGQCAAYYGIDASTGAFVEFTVGGAQNMIFSSQPLPAPDVPPLAYTTVEQVSCGDPAPAEEDRPICSIKG